MDSDENFYLDKLYSACEAHPTNYLLGLARVYGGLSQDDTARLDKCFNKKYNLEEKEFNEELLEVVGIYEKVANPLKLDSAELDDIYNDMKSRNSAQLYAPSYKSQIEKIQEGRKTAIDFITEYKKPPETKQPKSNISIFSMFRFTAKKDMYDPNDFAMFCVYADPAQQSELFSDSSTEDLANFLSKLEIGSKLYNTVTDPDFIVDFYEEDSGKFLNIFSSDTNLQNLITEAEKNIKDVDENKDVFLKFGEIRDLLSNSKSAHFPRN